MLKRLELNRIARRIEEEHGGLFAGFAFEADVWLDDEFRVRGLQPLGGGLDVAEIKYGVAKNHVGDGHVSIRRTYFHAFTIPALRNQLVVDRETGGEAMVRIVGEARLTAKRPIHRRLPRSAATAYAFNDGQKGIGINALVVGRSR